MRSGVAAVVAALAVTAGCASSGTTDASAPPAALFATAF